MKIGIEIKRYVGEGDERQLESVGGLELQHGDHLTLHVEHRVDAEGLAGSVNQLAHAIGGKAEIEVHERPAVGKSPVEIERDRVSELERDRAARREADVAAAQSATVDGKDNLS